LKYRMENPGEEEQEIIILNKRFCPLFFGTSKIRFGSRMKIRILKMFVSERCLIT